MRIKDKFPNAHSGFLKAYSAMIQISKKTDVFFAVIAAHEVMVSGLTQIARDNPEWKSLLAERLRMTASWLESKAPDSEDPSVLNDEIRKVVGINRFNNF